MVSRAVSLLCAMLAVSCGLAEGIRANPIRKVVTMLQDMQKSIEAEGEKEKELFEKFMCYCNNGAGALDASIQTGQQSVEQLASKVEEETAQKSQLEQDVVQHKTDREEAEKTVKESTAMREKEAAEFASASGEMKANVEAMGGALAALKKGLSASLLQSQTGSLLKNIIRQSPAIREGQRDELLSFLEGGSESEEGGSTDTIIGIVDQMRETMEGDLKETVASEEDAKASFATLTNSKDEEIAAAGKAIESKTARVGELAVSIVQSKNDHEDTGEAVDEDTKMKANLAKACATKQKEYDDRQKLRAEEIQAVSETIEMLNGDDALELFKKTLPSAASSLLQVSSRSKSQVRRAETELRTLISRNGKHKVNLKMMLLALKTKMGGGFDKVVAMVDNMVAVLAKEQADDDAKKDFCVAELNKAEGEEKALAGEVSDIDADIEEKSDQIATLASEIKALQQGIADMDKSVAQATEQRQDEHSEYADTAAANQAALELIGMAKNRMNKFYAPDQYKAPETTTESSSPYGFLQVSARADFGPAPDSFLEYKKSESSGGVMAMMGQMMKDVEMDIAEAKHDEADAQKDYEEAMQDAATKREEDSKLIVEKEGSKAELGSNLQDARELRATKSDQHQNAQVKLQDLHKDCDYLLKEYDARKEQRAKESDGLKEAKSVLAGASV